MFSTVQIFRSAKVFSFFAYFLTLSLSTNVMAKDLEFSLFGGQMYSSDLTSKNNTLSVDSGSNIGFAIAWQDTSQGQKGQGQIMFNRVSHDFKNSDNQQAESLDVNYLHFNGVAQFRQQHYVTTVSIGVGAAYFDTKYDEILAPSMTVALGTRYEISENLAIITEVRAYVSLTEEDEDVFCANGSCDIQFDDTLWVETNISIGLAYRF
jgi:hypothetical protein